MMFPNAVGGHMPFVPTAKQKKEKRDKERLRHKSAPNKVTMDKNSRNTIRSLPVLTERMPRDATPGFISEPDLQQKEACKDKSFFSNLISLFHKRKENKISLSSSPKNSPKGSPKTSPSGSPNTKHTLPTATDIYIAKRQRTRTNSSLYSNIVMEAIEEIEEPHEDEASISSEDETSHVHVVLNAVGIDIPRTRYLREDSLDSSLPGSSLE